MRNDNKCKETKYKYYYCHNLLDKIFHNLLMTMRYYLLLTTCHFKNTSSIKKKFVWTSLDLTSRLNRTDAPLTWHDISTRGYQILFQIRCWAHIFPSTSITVAWCGDVDVRKVAREMRTLGVRTVQKNWFIRVNKRISLKGIENHGTWSKMPLYLNISYPQKPFGVGAEMWKSSSSTLIPRAVNFDISIEEEEQLHVQVLKY